MLTPSFISSGSIIPDPLGNGQRAVDWLKSLRHPKSRAAGQAFALDAWQERIVRAIYGPRHVTDDIENGIFRGDRIVRRVFMVLPRGSRKTSLAAALTLLHLCGPERTGGDKIFSAASASEQAREIYDEALSIVNHDRRLLKHLRVRRGNVKSIECPRASTLYRAVSSNGGAQHGKTPRVIIIDELHAWRGQHRALWEALESSLAKQNNTLLIVLTTAGRGEDNLAWSQYQFALKVQKGEIDDPATLPVIFAAEKDDDWKDEQVWFGVNPGLRLGYPNLAAFRDEARKAEHDPMQRESFAQFKLNIWQEKSSTPFVEMGVYDKGGAPLTDEELEALKAKPCFIGVDMSIKNDLTAIVMAWRDDDGDGDPSFIVRPLFFCPADQIEVKARRDGVPYPGWVAEGHIIATPGPVIDHRHVAATLKNLCAEYDVRDIAFDPHRATLIMSELAEEGLPVAGFDQSWKMMAPAVETLKRAIEGGRFRHGANPVLRWNMSNISAVFDRNENITLHKSKSTDRIDGAVAAAMACRRAATMNTTPFQFEVWNI